MQAIQRRSKVEHAFGPMPTTRQRVGTAAQAVGYSVASTLIARDAAHLGKVARPAGLGLALQASHQAAKFLFPGQQDKTRHAIFSAAITGTVTILTNKRLVGIAAGIAAGVAKEFIDGSRLNPTGHRDFRLNGDLGADAIGIAFGALI
jgi:hypothetical protein